MTELQKKAKAKIIETLNINVENFNFILSHLQIQKKIKEKNQKVSKVDLLELYEEIELQKIKIEYFEEITKSLKEYE